MPYITTGTYYADNSDRPAVGAWIGLQTGAAAGAGFDNGGLLNGIIQGGFSYVGARGGPGKVFGPGRSVNTAGGGSTRSVSMDNTRSLTINIGSINSPQAGEVLLDKIARTLEIQGRLPAYNG